jgi:ABC-type nitrate/sulfonate/bicarbonate transport system substrate-binding protein
MHRRIRLWSLAGLCVLGVVLSAHAADEDYVVRYGLTAGAKATALGVQPLGFPSGVISAVMARDRTLKAALESAGMPLKTYAFRRGADMLGVLSEHRLEAGLLGDMPTILSAAAGKVWVVGLVKETSTAIVARDVLQVRDLVGRKVAYVPASSAHHTLLQGLASAGVAEADIRAVPMAVDEMPGALVRGEIDAFVAWEPAPTIALAKGDRNRIVFRGRSTDYFVLSREFQRRHPDAALALVAGFARAIEWMRRSGRNLELAARWSMRDAAAFAGRAPAVSIEQVKAITRREILNVPSAPVIVRPPRGEVPLQGQFNFLDGLGKLPKGASLDVLREAFGHDALERIMANPARHHLDEFAYDE